MLVEKYGGKAATVYGLAGLGDLYVSAIGGRNSLMGKYLGQGHLYKDAKELYMNKNDIKDLLADGMLVGSHTYNHYSLNTLTLEEQRKELGASLEFLKNIGVETDKWIMCYPHGDYNSDTISLLKENNCSFAVTTKP